MSILFPRNFTSAELSDQGHQKTNVVGDIEITVVLNQIHFLNDPLCMLNLMLPFLLLRCIDIHVFDVTAFVVNCIILTFL
jgi:hypothetical protein